MKALIAAGLVVALALGGVFAWHLHTAGASDVPPDPTGKVEKAPIRAIVYSTGKIISNLDVDIKCKAGGPIIKLPFDVSDVIHKGDLLVEVDPIDEEPKVGLAKAKVQDSEARLSTTQENLVIAEERVITSRAHAEAALRSAQAREADAKSKAHRMSELLAKNLASQEDFDTAQTASVQATVDVRNAQVAIQELKVIEQTLELRRQDIKSAQAQVDSDRINLAIEEQGMLDTKVFAPMDGVVSKVDVQIGFIIASAITNIGGGTTILTLSDLSHIFVDASVDESDIGRVRVGQDVAVSADSYPGVTFHGKVVRIATAGVNNSNVVTFDVKIEVIGENKALLKPEMTTNVEIIVADRKSALVVPLEAVIRKDGRMVAAVVKPGGQNQEVPVQVGINDGTRWEVLGGLTEGQTVVLRQSEAESLWHTDPNNLRNQGRNRGGRR